MLATETVGLKGADIAQREVRNKLKQEHTRNAVDDYHRGTFFIGRTAIDAVKGTRNYLKAAKQARLEKAKYKLQKAELRVLKEKSYKPKLKANKADVKHAASVYKKHKNAIPLKGNPIRKAMVKRRKQALKQSKRELGFERKQLLTEKKFKQKELKNQKKIMKDSKTGLLMLKPVGYSADRMKASAWQKAVNEDQDNDFVHAIDSAKRRVVEPVKDKVSKSQRLQRAEKKRDRLNDKETKSNQKWATDVTEFALFGTKLYLSPIIDLFNGEVVAYNLSYHPNLNQVTDMLNKAFAKIPDGTGLILHSDQGWQYQHKHYQNMLKDKGIRQSMSRKGNCLDNACAENLFSLLKTELLYLQEFDSVEHFISELHDYIKWYNEKRIKLRFDGLSPVEYRRNAA